MSDEGRRRGGLTGTADTPHEQDNHAFPTAKGELSVPVQRCEVADLGAFRHGHWCRRGRQPWLDCQGELLCADPRSPARGLGVVIGLILSVGRLLGEVKRVAPDACFPKRELGGEARKHCDGMDGVGRLALWRGILDKSQKCLECQLR